MNETVTPAILATDRFSWRRVGLIARYYFQPLKRSIIIFPLLSLAVGLFSLISMRYEINIFFAGLLSTILSFVYYWSPIVFSNVESSQLTLSLPCRWQERATFVMLFALVAMPLLILVPSYLLNELGCYLYTDNYVSMLARWNVNTDTSFLPDFIDILLKLSMSLLPFSVALYVIHRARKSRVLKAIAFSVVALITQTIVYGTFMGLLVVKEVMKNPEAFQAGGNIPVEEMLPMESISNASICTIAIIGTLAITFIILTIRRFKTVQIS